MLLSAMSVLVVAQSSSEIPEGLMNNPVLQKVQNMDNTVVQHDDKPHEHARMFSVDDRIKVANI